MKIAVHGLFATNDICRKIVEAGDGFFRWMCNVDPVNAETLAERLALYKKQGAVGIGEVTINDWINSEFLQQLFRAAEKLELPVTCHMCSRPGLSYGVCDRPGLPYLEETLKKFPNLKYVGHSQLFWMEISGDCPQDDRQRNGFGRGKVAPGGTIERLMDQYPNLYGDLSAYSGYCAITRDEEYGIYFLNKFSKRLMFATDTINRRTVFPLGTFLDDCLKNGSLRDEAYTDICGGNAKRIYRME